MATRNTIFQSSQSNLPGPLRFRNSFSLRKCVGCRRGSIQPYFLRAKRRAFQGSAVYHAGGLQAFEVYALDHAQFLAICQTLVCAWPLFHSHVPSSLALNHR